MAIKAGEIRYFLGLDTATFMRAVKQANASVAKARREAEVPFKFSEQGAGELLAKLAKITIAIAAIQQLSGTFREFETGIANIATLGVANIDELSDGILRIGAEAPIALNDLTSGLYQVVSAGVDANEQINVLELSAKAAKAGLAETQEALGLTASVVKAYGLEWSATENILDKAFQTVKLGQTTFGDLASNIGKVTPIAAALKVSTEELFGAMATLTGVTGDTAIVATQLRSILADVAEPSAELAAAIERAGFASAEMFIQSEGLAGLMKLLREETGGSAAEMNKYFGRIEAVNAALALSGAQFDTFIDKTGAMSTATGSMTEAFSIQSETLDSQIQVLENNFNILVIGILQGMLPALDLVVGTLADLIKAFANLEPWAQKTVIGIVALTAAILKGRAAVVSIRNSILLLQASLGPLGLITLAISTAATALVFFIGESDDATKSLQDLNAEFSRGDQRKFREEVSDTTRVLEGLISELDKWRYQRIIQEQFILQGQLKTLAAGTDAHSAALAKYNTLEAERQSLRIKSGVVTNQPEIDALERLTQKQREELDKRRQYEYETNRITLASYVSYLTQRQKTLKDELGAESTQFLKFQDRLSELELQLKVEIATEALSFPELEIRQPETIVQEIKQKATFHALTIQQLDEEYNVRRTLQEQRIEDARITAGEESEIYRQAVEEKINLEEQFQQRKNELEQGRVFTTTDVKQLEQSFNTFRTFQDQRIEETRRTAGEESEIYRQAVEDRINIERQFQQRKRELTFQQSFDEDFNQVISFKAFTIQQLEEEYNARRTFQELRIQEARRIAGEESQIYQQAIQERIDLEEQFQQRKFELSIQQTVSGGLQGDTFEQLQAEYEQRELYATLYIELARDTFGEETEQYRRATLARLQLERNFQDAKKRLVLQGVQATVAISSQLMNSAQGQSKFLFDIGKVASVANATINTYEAATKALATYPPPLGFAAMSAVLAAGFAQVGQIVATNFTPPAVPGFAEGSAGPLTQGDVFQSFLTPPGEHGIIGVRVGETIVNTAASRQFPQILKAMNEGKFNLPDIPGYQSGGVVGGTTLGSQSPTLLGTLAGGVTRDDLDRMIAAIADIRIEIHSALDAQQFYKRTFGKFEKSRNERRIT